MRVFMILILLFLFSFSEKSYATTIEISPENYGTIWYGEGPYYPALNYAEATNNTPDNGAQPFMGGISLNDYGYSRAIVTINTNSIPSIPFSYYYLDLDANSVWSGGTITSKVSLYSYSDNGLVELNDYNKGNYSGTFDLTFGNHSNGDALGRTYLDISDIMLTMIAANVDFAEINIRAANDMKSGILFAKPWIIASTEALGQPAAPISSVPLPPALPLFAVSLLGISFLRKRNNYLRTNKVVYDE